MSRFSLSQVLGGKMVKPSFMTNFLFSNRFPDISYEWLCYSTVEEVQTLIDHLSHQGIRESALKKSLKEKLKTITDAINRRFV